MKHVSILVPKGSVIINTIEGTYNLLNTVNQFMASKDVPPLFNVQIVGETRDLHDNNGLFPVKPQVTMDEVEKTDLIIIPAMTGEPTKMIEENKKFISWIIKQYHRGAEVGSLCVGAFLLAATGLVNGKKCTTHWLFANNFRNMFPEVNLMPEKIITDEHRIYTSGGAYSFTNLILYLVEKYAGREVAIYCSKTFEIEFDRTSQSPFIVFHGQKTHDDREIKKVQEFIEENYADKIIVDQLAQMLAVGRRNLERRFKKATASSVGEYIQRVRIEAAKMSLESSLDNVTEVMFKTGYSDTKAFRTSFKKFTGLSPLQYRNKYNRRMVLQKT